MLWKECSRKWRHLSSQTTMTKQDVSFSVQAIIWRLYRLKKQVSGAACQYSRIVFSAINKWLRTKEGSSRIGCASRHLLLGLRFEKPSDEPAPPSVKPLRLSSAKTLNFFFFETVVNATHALLPHRSQSKSKWKVQNEKRVHLVFNTRVKMPQSSDVRHIVWLAFIQWLR